MSDHSHAAAPLAEHYDAKHSGKLPTLLIGAAGIGLLGSLIVGLFAPQQFAYSYLFAFTYFFTLCVGCLFWVCVHHATDSEWGILVRRQLENVASLLPWFALIFIPVLFCAPILLKWWNIAPGVDPLLDAKQPYLSHGFFYLRAAIYFILLGGVAFLLRRSSMNQDRDGAARHTFTMRKLGIIGIPALAVSLTFAAVDWLMGLDYHWFSTMWGVYIFAGAAGSGMSLLVLIVTGLRQRGYLKPVTMEHYHVMGKFMLAFCIFWAYIGYSQYMLIWYANIPEETIYFRIRNTESWHILSTLLVIFRFFLPFPLLLLQATKKTPRFICAVAWLILAMQVLDLYIIVLPALHPTGFSPHILDVLTFVGIGGVVGLLFLRVLGKSPTFPLRDPRLAGSIRLAN